MWIILMALLGLSILVGFVCLVIIFYCRVRIEPPKKTIASVILEENNKRWLEKKAEADAWLNEQKDSRPNAKILKFTPKI